MNILVTAGNTHVPIDKVRVITNIFTGRTGAGVALEAHQRGHHVTLLTSHPEVVAEVAGQAPGPERWTTHAYRTFAELEARMADACRADLDAVIHSAAVSDYLAAGVYGAAPGTRFDPATGHWHGQPPALLDRAAAKVKSDEPELWLRLVRAPKLIDRVRADWRFGGVLVKFKLEVGVGEGQLREIAERSRLQSGADLMVANTLEGASDWALLGPLAGKHQRIPRRDLAVRLVEAVEAVHQEKRHG